MGLMMRWRLVSAMIAVAVMIVLSWAVYSFWVNDVISLKQGKIDGRQHYRLYSNQLLVPIATAGVEPSNVVLQWDSKEKKLWQGKLTTEQVELEIDGTQLSKIVHVVDMGKEKFVLDICQEKLEFDANVASCLSPILNSKQYVMFDEQSENVYLYEYGQERVKPLLANNYQNLSREQVEQKAVLLGETVDGLGFELQWASRPWVSPDGKYLVFMTNRVSAVEGKIGATELWAYNFATGMEQVLMPGDAMNLSWGNNQNVFVNEAGNIYEASLTAANVRRLLRIPAVTVDLSSTHYYAFDTDFIEIGSLVETEQSSVIIPSELLGWHEPNLSGTMLAWTVASATDESIHQVMVARNWTNPEVQQLEVDLLPGQQIDIFDWLDDTHLHLHITDTTTGNSSSKIEEVVWNTSRL